MSPGTTALAEIGSSPILAAVIFGVLASVATVFVLLTVPKRIGPLHMLGSVVVVGLLGLGLWAAFSANPPAATTTTAVPAGGEQFPPVGPQGPNPSGQPAPSPAPSPSGSPTSLPCRATGSTRVTVTAPVGASVNGFAQNCLAVPAGKDFSVTFKNDDTGVQHTWALFKDPSATDRLGGAQSAAAFITGPAQKTYQLKALPAGTYFFHCDLHPTVMKGAFVVAG
jgi:plastocyanin